MRLKWLMSICCSIMILLSSCSILDSAIWNKEQLFLIKESEHGMFYSPSNDVLTSQVIEQLEAYFETHYTRITDMFNYTPAKKTIIHVYTDREQFYKAMGRETEGTYDARSKTIKVYTPTDLTNYDVYSEYMFQIVHEFVHAVIQQVNPKVGQAKWLDEGTAYYATQQLSAELEHRFTVRSVPTFEQFNSSTFFNDFGGDAYFYSGLIIKYIVEQYGEDVLNDLIKHPKAFEEIMNKSMEDFYMEWKAGIT